MAASTFKARTGFTIAGPTSVNDSDVDIYSGSGTPESVQAANPGSLWLDYTNGKVYYKGSGIGNTGWQEISSLNVIDFKQSVRLATKAALPAYGGTGTGTLTGTIPNQLRDIDGVTPALNDRILVKYENGTGADVDNGIYSVTTLGVDSTAEISSVDVNGSATLTSGDYFAISSPSNTYWVWYNVAGGGGAPSPTTEILVEVAVGAADASSVVATATKGALDLVVDLQNAGGAVFSTVIAGAGSDELTITNNQGGVATDVVDGTAATGFTIATDTQGANDGTQWVLTRSTDADEDAEVTAGMFMFIEEGTSCADTGWVLSTNNPITVNTTPLQFVQFTGSGLFTGGNGIDITGSVISVDLDATSGLEFNSGKLRINVDATNNTTNLNAANELEVIGYANKSGTGNFASFVTIDTVPMTSDGESAQWLIEVTDGGNSANRESWIVYGLSDGTTNTDFDESSRLVVGSNAAIKADFDVTSDSTNLYLRMRSQGSAQADLDYVVKRLSLTIT